MTSAGALVSAGAFRGRDAVVSGPAGGVVGVARPLKPPKRAPCWASTWAAPRPTSAASPARWSGATRTTVAGVKAARADAGRGDGGGRRRLDPAPSTACAPGSGPTSAGADPGPAAYGRGGPATVTDANLVLGRLDPACVPGVFGPSGDAAAGCGGRARRAGRAGAAMGAPSAEAAAAGFVAVAVEQTAAARSGASPPSAVSIRASTPWWRSAARQGKSPVRSPRRWASTRCSAPRYASVLSAWGIGQARMRAIRQRGSSGRWTAPASPRRDPSRRGLTSRRAADLAEQGARRRRRRAAAGHLATPKPTPAFCRSRSAPAEARSALRGRAPAPLRLHRTRPVQS